MTHSHDHAAAGHAAAGNYHGEHEHGGHDHTDDPSLSFDERAATWDDDAKIAQSKSAAAAVADAVLPDGSTRLLDYGGGTGLLLQFLAPRVGSSTLADASAGMRAVAAGKVASGVLPASTRIWELNLDEHEPPAEQFDLITVVLALHHVTDVPRVLTRLGAMLAPGGHLCVIDLEAEDGSFHGEGAEVAHGFDPATLDMALDAAGLTATYRHGIYEIDRDGRPYPLFLAVCTRREPGA